MANIYRYDNLTNTAGIYQDPIGGYRLSINGNVKVKGDLCFYKEGTTDSYCLQDLIFIKSLEANTLQLSTTNKLELKLNDTGAIKNNSNGLYINKYDRHFEIINDPVNVDNGKIRLKFDTTDSCLLSSTTGLAVRTDNISITKKSHPESAVTGEDSNDLTPNFGAKSLSVLCAPNGGIKIKMTSPAGIMIDYKDTHFKINGTLQLLFPILSVDNSLTKNSETDELKINLKEVTNINKSGLKVDSTGLSINFDTNTLELGLDNQLQVKDIFQKKLTIVNNTSLAFVNSRITLTSDTLTFTEGSLAKQYRDDAEKAKNDAEQTKIECNTIKTQCQTSASSASTSASTATTQAAQHQLQQGLQQQKQQQL
jgi:hypothetical protein